MLESLLGQWLCHKDHKAEFVFIPIAHPVARALTNFSRCYRFCLPIRFHLHLDRQFLHRSRFSRGLASRRGQNGQHLRKCQPHSSSYQVCRFYQGCFSSPRSIHKSRKFSVEMPGSPPFEMHSRIRLEHTDFYWGTMPLMQRGWTYQERLLSPRTLHFTDDELILECLSGITCECSDDVKMPRSLSRSQNWWPETVCTRGRHSMAICHRVVY